MTHTFFIFLLSIILKISRVQGEAPRILGGVHDVHRRIFWALQRRNMQFYELDFTHTTNTG
jgi:hypothetical protein